MGRVITIIKQIFQENPENAINTITTFTSNDKRINKCWINIGDEKFGKLTLDQILNNKKYSIHSKNYTMDISPLDVIGSYQKPFIHTSLINILNAKMDIGFVNSLILQKKTMMQIIFLRSLK